MKRLLLTFVLICTILLACTLSRDGTGTGSQANATGTGSQANTTGTGSQANAFLSDPQVGLGSLDDYTTTLTVSFKGTQAGQPVDLTDTYVQSEWPKLAAQFTSIDVMDDSEAHQVILSGAVGDAQYYQADPNSPCTVNWGETAGGPANFMPASLLPSVTTAKLADEQTLDGIATQHYTFDAASLGLPGDASASGETWIATQGGYVVKYILDINGADSVFGTGVTGTRHVEYSLSEIGAQAQVVYPAGCEPVLSDMPAMEDASDLTRLPGLLDYLTNATQNDIFAFYQDKLTAMGWQKNSDDGIGTDSATMTFNRSDSSVDATVAVEVEGSSQRVTVMIPVQGSVAAATPSGETNQNPTQLIALAMGKLIGDENTPSVFPSYSISMNESLPSASGSDTTTLQADVQGANYHFVLSSGGTQTDAIHYNGQDYSVVSGKAQPGSATLALNWDMWKLDPAVMFGAATASTLTAQAGTTLEGRQVDVYTVDSSTLGAPLPDLSMGMLPYVVTAIQGTIWIDHATGGLVKADLQFEANVKKPGETTPSAPGKGELHITVSQIGQVTVSLP